MKNKGQIQDGKYYYKYWSLLIFLLIPVLLLARYYFAGQVPGDADLIQFFSNKKAFAEALMSGEFPQWNPYIQNGIPQSSGSSMYFLNLLLSFLPLRQYIYAFYIVHLAIAGICFYLFLRDYDCPYSVSYSFAIIFECSIQINGMRKSHPAIITAICVFTVVMFVTKRYFVTKQKRWFCLSALTAGVMLIATQQYGIYAALVLVIYILAHCIKAKFSLMEILKKALLWIAVYIGSILFALLPTVHLLRTYSVYGSSQTTYDTFRSYSLHPVKLIQMIYPEFFGEKYQAMGANYSSEMDIELYLGIFVLFAAMFAIIKLWKKFDTALAGGCALFALLYACVAHIPVINKIVYHIPVLGGFRASGRMLFAFYFFVFLLSALGTSEFLKEIKKKDIVLLKKAAKGLLGLTAVLILTSVSAVCLIVAREQQGAYFIQIQSAFKTALIVAVLMLIVCWILSKDNIYKITLTIQKKRSIICIFLLGITLYETLPYSMATTSTDYKAGISQEPVVEKIQENIGQYKIFDAFGNVDGSHMSIISQNRNAIRKIASLNAYTAYNNPLLCKYLKNLGSQVTDIPFNYSGLLTGSLDNTNNVLIQNDLLSMTGVKYVIDSEGAIAKNKGMIYSNQSPTESCYSSQLLQITHKPGEIGIFETPFSMMTQEQEQTPQCYKVVITLTEEQRKNTTCLAADLYGGPNYDRSTEEKRFQVTEDQGQYTAYLYAQQTELATETIRLRILASNNDTENSIYKVDVFKVTPVEGYRYWDKTQDGTAIYENINAKPLLYVPQTVETKKNFDDIYFNCDNYSLNKIAYVDAEPMDLQNSDTQVEVKEQTRNTVMASCSSTADTFVCFSQNYSPDWRVYVDGEQQTIHMVNGLIMGVQIPAGNHEIKFVYQENSYLIGAGITFITYVSLVAAYFVERRRKYASADKKV